MWQKRYTRIDVGIKKLTFQDAVAATVVTTVQVSVVLNGNGKKYRMEKERIHPKETARHTKEIIGKANFRPGFAARNLHVGQNRTGRRVPSCLNPIKIRKKKVFGKIGLAVLKSGWMPRYFYRAIPSAGPFLLIRTQKAFGVRFSLYCSDAGRSVFVRETLFQTVL